MSARKRRITLSEDWRERIKIGEIMSRLNRHVMGDIGMSQTQIAAAKLLLSKVAPDLRSIEYVGDRNSKRPDEMSDAELATAIEQTRKLFRKRHS